MGLLAGCSSGLGECPDDSEAEQAAGALVVQEQCANCHSSTLTGEARQSAPTDFNFDTTEGIKKATSIMWEEAESGAMPPEGALSDDDLESLRVFLSCQ
jgi:uncharacterized membrane protein